MYFKSHLHPSTSFQAVLWDGLVFDTYPHPMPAWLERALLDMHVTVMGDSTIKVLDTHPISKLLTGGNVKGDPGDWVVRNDEGQLMIAPGEFFSEIFTEDERAAHGDVVNPSFADAIAKVDMGDIMPAGFKDAGEVKIDKIEPIVIDSVLAGVVSRRFGKDAIILNCGLKFGAPVGRVVLPGEIGYPREATAANAAVESDADIEASIMKQLQEAFGPDFKVLSLDRMEGPLEDLGIGECVSGPDGNCISCGEPIEKEAAGAAAVDDMSDARFLGNLAGVGSISGLLSSEVVDRLIEIAESLEDEGDDDGSIELTTENDAMIAESTGFTTEPETVVNLTIHGDVHIGIGGNLNVERAA